MSGVFVSFGWGFLGAASLLIGALVAGFRTPSRRTLGLVMGFGSGVLLSAVSFELAERALGGPSPAFRTAAFAFFAGAVVFVGGDTLISRMGYANRKSIEGVAPTGSGLAITLGIVLDGVPESAVLGLTVLQSGTVGAAVLAAVVISNVPEAVAATSSLRGAGWSLTRVCALWSGTAIVCGVAAAAGYRLLDGAPPEALAFVLAFAAGAILAMLSTTMVPEAFQHAGRATGLATTGGFALALAISSLAGG